MRIRTLSTMATVIFASGAFAADYNIDNAHSSTVFRVNHLGSSFVYGMIPDVSGNFSFDPDHPDAARIDVTANVASVNTFNGARDKHISGPDFFDAKQFPTITFKSTSWKSKGNDRYDVTGDLTLLGVTKSVTATALHVGFGKNRAGKTLTGFEAELTIDRTDFGMNYGVAAEGGLGKDVRIIVSVEGVVQ